MTFTPTYDGFALDSTNGVSISGLEDLGRNSVKLDRTLGGGGALRHSLLEGRIVNIKGTVTGTTSAAVATALDNLLAKLHQSGQAVLGLNGSRFLDCWCSPARVSWEAGASGLVARWSASFMSDDAFWREAAEDSDSQVDAASINNFEVVNAGTAPTWPTFELVTTSTAATGAVFLRNDTTSKECKLNNINVIAGDTLVINTGTGQVYIKSPANASSATPDTITGAFWELAVGTNSIEYEVSWAATSSITCTVKHYPRHHHLGDVTP